jgi:uncharacterized membrane protein
LRAAADGWPSGPGTGRVFTQRVLLGLAWAAIALMAFYFVQRDALNYLDYSPEAYRHHWALRGWLIPHILGAGPALLIAPLQFSSTLRQRHPRIHRWIGRIYVFGCLLASLTALRLAFGSRCAPCVPPLSLLSLLWFTVTALAFWAALRGAFALHRQFMIRSYVLMNAFVVIRLTDFVSLPLPITDEHTVRSVFEWLCWVVPLLATEAWLTWRPLLRAAAARPVARGSATVPNRTQ